MTAASGVFVSVRERAYRVVGTTPHHLQESAVLLCPHRRDARHVGYTDWRIAWSYAPRRDATGHVVSAVRVEVDITCTLPRWEPPRVAAPALVATWGELLAAIADHERGHRDIAVSGAHALHGALMSSPPCGSLEELERRVAGTAESALEAIRASDLAYDEATEHGARQGVVLPW